MVAFRLILCFVLFAISFSEEEVVSDTSKIDISKLDTLSIEEKLEYLPDAFLKDLDNKKVSMHDILDARPTLISFWFLACEPCKKEMKFLDKFNKDYSDKGFKVLSINTDNSRTMNRLKSFVKSKNYSFKILIDPKSLFFKKLGGKICPYLVLVDHDGKIVSRHTGYNPGD